MSKLSSSWKSTKEQRTNRIEEHTLKTQNILNLQSNPITHPDPHPMITKQQEEEEELPGSSFVQVGRSLEETPPLIGYEDQGSSDILILEEEEDKSVSAMSRVSLNSFDVEAADDLVSSIKTKDRIIYAVSLMWIVSSLFLWHSISEAKGRERTLHARVDGLIKENANLKFDQIMSRSDDAIFEVDNCYFNFKATGALGQCADDVSRTAHDWFEWGVDALQSILEDDQSEGREDGPEAEENPDFFGDIYNEFRKSVSSHFSRPDATNFWEVDTFDE